MAITERVKASASLRRVRPNISQTKPSKANGPAATATHDASSGEVSGRAASACPADQALKASQAAASNPSVQPSTARPPALAGSESSAVKLQSLASNDGAPIPSP